MDKLLGLKDLLHQHDAEYELICHEEQIRSVEDAKKYFDITQTAPTLIVKQNYKYLALIVSGVQEHIDFKLLKHIMNGNEIKLASKNEIKKATGFTAGNIPLVGLDIPYILDRKLLDQSYIFGGSGIEQYTLKIKVCDLVNIIHPTIIDFENHSMNGSIMPPNHTNVKILKADSQDLRQILDLQHLAYQSEATLYNNPNIPPLSQTLEDMRAEFERGVFLKAISKNGQLVGSVRAYSDNGTLYIGKLIVRPDLQGQGIGTKLLKEIEHICPHKRYELFTGTKSTRNITLYERVGYVKFKEQTMSNDLTFVYLCKTVN